MSSLYFILKNSVITFVLVSLMQVKFGSKTVEERLMGLVRTKIAPSFLGSTNSIKNQPISLSKKDLENLKKTLKESSVLKKAKKGTSNLIIEELKQIMIKREAQIDEASKD